MFLVKLAFPAGFHVHEKGDISAGCASMLTHYNPDMVALNFNYKSQIIFENIFSLIFKFNHGAQTDKIRHEGDLGNIQANAAGVASMTIVDNYSTLSGPRSIIGRGLVIHNNRDDLGKGGAPDSLTTGNSGSRIACSVIGYM